jgi:hypothetical protein
MKPRSGNPETDEVHEAALAVTRSIEEQSGMKIMNDSTCGLHMEEAYRKITQDNDDLDVVETPPPNTLAKPTGKLSRGGGSIIDLTESGDESVKAGGGTEIVVKQEPSDDISMAKKQKGKGVARPAKGGSGGGNVVAKTYRHGDGKVTGKTTATETVLGSLADHLSPEAQEKRDFSRINLLRESRHQDRQDRALEEREKEVNKIINDLKQQNDILWQRAVSAETTLNLTRNFNFPPGIPTPTAYPPAFHAPPVAAFTPDLSCYEVPATTHNHSEPEGVAGPGPQTMQYRQEDAGGDDFKDWEAD